MTQQETFDIAVIGAGINGAGIARDAALRGLKVIVFDKNDMCSGCSYCTQACPYEVPVMWEGKSSKCDACAETVRAGGRPAVGDFDTFRVGGFDTYRVGDFDACGVDGVRPGAYCEPKMTTVGSQDTTGAMTRDELKELACLGFSADLVMQSFCHTAAYPKPVDIKLQHELPDFMQTRGGVSLRPGDGIIHSWLNRMILPDTVGTGGDSHTRFPMGISFPAGSGLVAFGAALGVMPLDMPESVLVRFKGKMQPGITLRDLVNAIPYAAIQKGLLTVEKKGKKNVFNGRVLEIEGLPDMKVEQAFELSEFFENLEDVPARERFAAGYADLVDAEFDEGCCDQLDFLEGEQLLAWHELHLLGHAVLATQVAAASCVGNGKLPRMTLLES